MFSNYISNCIVILFLLALDKVSGRQKWLERDGRAVYLYPRRLEQEQPAVLEKIRNACPGQVCGVLSGEAVSPLLGAAPECSQQDLADDIIDASQQFDATTKAAMVSLAIEYRQIEKNTPPDFTVTPSLLRNSVFCQKQPRNPQLNGLVQAQDPGNDPNLFFDPALGTTVRKGDQPNTSPPENNVPVLLIFTPSAQVSETVHSKRATSAETATTSCATAITVTVSGTGPVVTAANAVTVTFGEFASSTTTAAPATTTTVATTPDSVSNSNFGACTTPQIQFGTGFDGRKETSFEPVDKASFNHGSSQDVQTITKFMCDTLTNSCKANQAAKDECQTAQAAALTAPSGSGAQADAFNRVFGIQTSFVDVPQVDDTGKLVSGGSTSLSSSAFPTATISAVAASPAFGKCSTPQIEFGAGFDGRRETSFQPTDKSSFNHGSATDISIITQFICDALTNSCGANQAAKNTCATAQTAASAAAANTGAQADAFNAAFGIRTNFAAVQVVNEGTPANPSPAIAVVTSRTAPPPSPTTTRPPPTTAAPVTATAGGNLQTFTEALGGIPPPRSRKHLALNSKSSATPFLMTNQALLDVHVISRKTFAPTQRTHRIIRAASP
ncbi:hypothetical protein BD779DRAFT_577336 [Infundibulicybe gibba]|nr:hypothetical protein BD779DRAFT_577336 [Infundibulicybe gibba]